VRGLAFAGALLLLGVFAPAAHACDCGEWHPAMHLAAEGTAFVGTVESKTDDSYTFVIERVLKGDLPADRITLSSPPSHCQAALEVGQRTGIFGRGGQSISGCDTVDADALLAAADLPAPSGDTRFVAAVQAGSTDTVGLNASGGAAGYGVAQGGPMAVARCGASIVTASRSTQDGPQVRFRRVPELEDITSVTVPLRNVLALSCNGSTIWAAGAGGLVKIVRGKAALVRRITKVGAATFTSARAHLAGPGGLHVVTLATGRERIFHHYGEFSTLSVNRGRVAGRLLGGGVATLIDGRLRLSRKADGATWLTRDRLIDTERGQLLDTLLRPVRRISRIPGTVVAVEDGAAYVAEGNVVRRLVRGATRARVFARLPGRVVALTSVAPTAAASWHSCEESAKDPLTT
jgi:hypothetical protein